MYGLLYLILLKNTIYDILGNALLSYLHMKIQYMPLNKIFEKSLNVGILGNEINSKKSVVGVQY